jgi:hypothetical protein
MDRYPLVGGSILAVVLLVLGSLTNVIGYRTFQSSNQKIINEEGNQKELLFQTIVDIANNREVQEIILKSQINREGFFNLEGISSMFTLHVFTKRFLNATYSTGLILARILSKSKIHSLCELYQMSNQVIYKKIIEIIEKNTALSEEIGQLSISQCHCGDVLGVTGWSYPILCAILFALLMFGGFLIYLNIAIGPFIVILIVTISTFLGCSWVSTFPW